nr:hypothetical protein [Tanacetum cinerariifolium]
IDAGDLEEMDLKWKMAMLTVRARRFLLRTGRNLGANGPTSMGFDKSKVKCYNCYRKGHSARECRSPKDTRRNGAAEPQRRNVPIETSTLNVLVSQCDGMGSYDWSFQAEEEPTNYALIAFTSSSSSSDNKVVSCSKACTKAYATLQSHYDKLTDKYRKSQFDVIPYKTGLESVEARLLVYKQNESVFKEDIKLLNLESDDSLPSSPIYDRYQSKDGYHVVPPPYTGTFMPPKPDLVFNNEPNAVDTVHTAFNVELGPTKPDTNLSLTHRPLAPIIEDWVSDLKDDSEAKILQNTPSFILPNEQVKPPRSSVKPFETFILAANPKTTIPKPKSKGNNRNRKACFFSHKLLVNQGFLLVVLDLIQESLSPQVASATKLPILNPNEFDLRKMRIEQYFLMTDYSLWEVILDGDSYAPTRVIEGVVQPIAPTTAEQRLARKNELKARGTLLMALLDKHQLKFNIHKDTKTLMESIEKRFRGNKETKKVQKTLIKKQYKNFTGSSSESLDQIHDRAHTLIWRNKTDLAKQSLDDLFNRLKIYEAEPVSSAASVSAVSAKIPISALPNIDAGDLEKMDLKWQMAMLTVRARKGHFARECRSPKDTRRNGAAEPQRRNVLIETSTSNVLVSQCNGVGSYDWSFQAKEEPTNYALIAFTSSSSSSDNKPVFTRSMFDCDDYCTSESDDSLPSSPIYDRYQSKDGYHVVPPPYTGTFMPPKSDLVFHNAPNAVDTVHTAFNVELSPTKPDTDLSLTHRPLAPIIEDWVSDSKDDSEAKILQNTPSIILPNEQVKPPRSSVKPFETSILAANPKTTIPKPKSKGKNRNRKACFGKSLAICQNGTSKSPKACGPTIILTKSKLVPITAARPVTTAVPKTNVTRPRHAKTIVTKSHSPPRRHINRSPSPKARNISYMSNFEELNGGYVAFGGNPKGGKISSKGEDNVQQYVLFPVWSSGSNNPQNTDGDVAFEEKEPEFKRRKSESKVNISSSKFEDFSDNNINEVNAAGSLVPAVRQVFTNNTNTFSADGPSNAVVSPTYGKSSNKKDERGIVVRNKALLVAQGNTLEEGIDYEEGFAPVARIEAISNIQGVCVALHGAVTPPDELVTPKLVKLVQMGTSR